MIQPMFWSLFLILTWATSVRAFGVVSPVILLRERNQVLPPICASSSGNDEDTDASSPTRFPIHPISRAKDLAKQGRDTLQTRASEGVRSVQNAASSLDQTGKSVVGAAWSKGTEGVQTVQQTVASKLDDTGRTTVTSAAGAAWSGVNQLASTGASAAQAAGSGIVGLAKTATNTAGSAGSSLLGLAQQGTSTASNLAQWMDAQAKEGAATTNAKAQEIVLQFTGKHEYQFGDISKEVLRRGTDLTKDVEIRDVMLLLKVLLTLGATITPLAKLLPVTVLLEMLNVSLETRLGGQILKSLAGALDERFLAAFSADELGDVAKRSLSLGIAAFTGKESYQKGDIEQAVKDQTEEKETNQAVASAAPPFVSQPTSSKTLNLMVGPEFAEWDQTFLRETNPSTDLDRIVEESLLNSAGGISREELDREFVAELDEWDQQFRALYPDNDKQR